MRRSAAIAAIGDYAILGGLSAVHQFVRIGESGFVGGMSGVENDVIPFGSAIGNRAELGGLNIVGLTRRGFSREAIHQLRRAYRHALWAGGDVEGAPCRRGGRVFQRRKREENRGFHPRGRRPRDLHAAPRIGLERSGMSPGCGAERLAILAGGGRLPSLVTAAALRDGRAPVVFAIDGEADPHAFTPAPVHVLRWGEIGKLFRLTGESRCREAVLIGSITHRPDYRMLMPDFGALKFIPRILQLMRGRDGSLLDGVARIIEENGIHVVSSPRDRARSGAA